MLEDVLLYLYRNIVDFKAHITIGQVDIYQTVDQRENVSREEFCMGVYPWSSLLFESSTKKLGDLGQVP